MNKIDINFKFDFQKYYHENELKSFHAYEIENADTLYKIACSYGHMKNYDKAAEFSLHLLKKLDSKEAVFLHAICNFYNENYADVLKTLSDNTYKNSDDFNINILLGMSYRYLGIIWLSNLYLWNACVFKSSYDLIHLLESDFENNHPEKMILFPFCRGKGIDVGCGHRKTHPDCTGIDIIPRNIKGKFGSVAGFKCEADIKAFGDNLNMFKDMELDYIVQRHNLEYYTKPEKTLIEWRRILKPGGIIAMLLADNENIDSLRIDSARKRAFSMDEIKKNIEEIGGLKIIYLAEFMKKWSFICILQKDNEGNFTDKNINVENEINNFIFESILKNAEIYESRAELKIADQCRDYYNYFNSNYALES